MVNDKYVVKYLDPRTGKYEYATIKDVGDLQKLNTKVKTSIVDAINSISIDEIGALRNNLDTIGSTIKSLEDGTLELGDFQSIDDVVSREIEDAINSLKLENSGLLQLTQEEINTIVSNAESEYRDSIAASVRELETSRTDLEAAREKMTTIGQMLENADIDYSNLTQVVDDINLYITDVIEKTDFDMVNGIVSDYKTAVTQTQDGWGVDASKNMLSYLTGRVKSNETSLDVQHGLIQAKVGKDEFQYMTVDNLPAGKENMLHNTSDLTDWSFSSAFIFKSADDYRFTSIVQSDSAGENIIGTTDELEQGATYAISTYVNVQNKNKEPNEEKYAPTDGAYTATVIIDGDTIELNNVVEDNSALDGWKRVSGTFIAKRTAQQDIKFYVTAFNRDTQVGYLSAPKLEKGSSATSWIPHIEDNVSTILSQNAVMRVLSDRITSSVEEVRETKGAFETATSTFDQMADGFELNTNKLSEVLDKYGEVTGVQTQQASQLEVLNDSITSKVWKQDINTTLDTINIDTSNRIVNSAFNIYSYDEQTGALQLDYWDNNTGFEIKKHSQSLDNYLYATRSNATSVNPISIKSSPFALRDGEKILFNFEYLAVGNPLDDDNVFTLEMYDNNDVRVGLQEFRLSELKKEFLTAYDVGDSYKYNGSYIVKNSSVVKGTITLKLPKNGELWLTKVMLQNAGIGTIGWTPSSIDNQIIQSKLSTEINQLADSIELVANDERLDAISGLLVKKDGKITISPEAIVSRVTSQELGDNALITQTSLTQTEDNLRFDLVDKEGVIQTINASSEGLLIDFDKVQIDGELIARMISAQSIDATQGFRLTDNNGNTLLAVVNDNGTPTLSIARDFNVKFRDVSNKLDVTVVNVVDEYYHSTSQDEPVGGQWTSAPNDFRGDTFVWKRTKVVLQSGKEYYLPDENGINITSGWNYAKGEVTNAIESAIEEAEQASQAAQDADTKAQSALTEAGANSLLINSHQDTLNTINDVTIPNINTSISNVMSEAESALSSANSAMEEAKKTDGKIAEFGKTIEGTISNVSTTAQQALDKANTIDSKIATVNNTITSVDNRLTNSISTSLSKAQQALDEANKADGKIADYVTRNGLVSGTTVDSKINDATGEVNKKITTVESDIKNLDNTNLFSYLNRNVVNEGTNGTLTFRDDTPYGFYMVGTNGDTDDIRMYDVLDSNGFYTISFDMKGTQNGGAYLNISANKKAVESAGISLRTTADNNYHHFSKTIEVTDFVGDGTDYISFNPSWAYVYLKNIKVQKGKYDTGFTPALADQYTQHDFQIFESTYSEDVKGINSALTDLSTKKLDGTTYTNFYENDYKRTAKDATDAYTAVNKIVSEDGTVKDVFSQAVYEQNASRQRSDFNEVTKDLVKQATYESDIDGVSQSITRVEGKLDNIKVGGRNLLLNSSYIPYRQGIEVDYKGSLATKLESPSSTNYTTYIIEASEDLIQGETYTYSALVAFEGVKPDGIEFYLPPLSTYTDVDGFEDLEEGKYGRVYFTRKASTDGPISRPHLHIRGGEGYVYFTKWKLEKGNIATDWSPAPEDTLLESDFKSFQADYEQNAQGITSRLSVAENNITANNQAFTTFKENDYKRTAERVSDTFTKQETTTMLGSKADASQLSNYLAKSTYERDAEQSRERFETIESDLGNISVGGRNLFRNSNFANELNWWQHNGQVTRVKVDGNDAILLTGTNQGFFQIPTQVEDGGVYTISFKAKSVGDSSQVRFGFLNQPTGNVGAEYIDNTWKTYSFTTSGYIDTNLNTYVHFYAHRYTAEGVYITDLKIEKGTIATDWTPAPEDMANLSYVNSEITKSANAITTSLSNYELKTSVDSKLSSMATSLREETAEGMKTVYTKSETNTLLGNKADSSALNNYVQTATYNEGIDGVSQSLTRVEGKVDGLQVGGRNLVLNSSKLEASGLGATSGSRAEYQRINTGESYMDLEDGEIITISFDIEMKIATANPTLQVYNTNVPGRVGIPQVSVSDQLQGDVGETINKRISFTTHAILRDSPSYSYNTLEFYSNYGTSNFYKISKLKVERGNVATDWTPAPEDTLSQDEYKTFKSDYESTVQGISGQITTLSTNKLDGNTYTNFLSNEYKATAERATSAFTKVNKVIDANGNSTDAFAKAVYDRNATRQSADFQNVTKDLVQTATYEAGINGATESIQSVRGDINNLGARNYFIRKEENVNKLYAWSSGVVSSENGSITSDLIDVKEGDVFSSNTLISQVGFYDNNKTYLGSLQGSGGALSKTSGGTYDNFTVPSGKNISFMRVTFRNNIMNGITLDELKVMLNKGNVALDWTPAPEEMLGQVDFQVFKSDYERNDQAIKNRLTAIDSGEAGSVVSRLNATESTASGNSQLIATINSNYVKQSNIDASILADKKIKDTRSTNQSPSWYFTNYPSQEVREFKQVSTMGIGSGTFGILTTNVPWAGSSGGTVKQSFETNTETYVRQSNTGATAWGAWSKQIDTSDTTYQKVTQTSSLYERVLGSTDEAGVKSNISRVVQTSGLIQQQVLGVAGQSQNLIVRKDEYKNKYLSSGSLVNSSAGTSVMKDKIPVVPGEMLTFTKTTSTKDDYWRIEWYDSNEKFINRLANTNNLILFQVPEGASYLWVSYPRSSNVQLERGENRTDWKPSLVDIQDGYGGRNLLKNSDFSEGFTSWGRNNASYVQISETTNSAKITKGTGASGLYQHISADLDEGEIYTISAEVKGTGSIRIGFNDNRNIFDIDGTGWNKFSYTSTFESSKAAVFYSHTADTEFEIKNLQVERGMKATAWTPNPEDTSSKITQLSDSINLKVSKADLISQINVQAGSVLIQSGTNKLNITPTTTYIQNGTIKSAMIDTISANQIKTGTLDADLITSGIASKTGNRVTITNTGMKISDSAFETDFINGGPSFFTKSSTGRTFIGEIGDMTNALNSSKALGIKGAYNVPVILGVQMSPTDTTYTGKVMVHRGGVAVFDSLQVEGDIFFTENGAEGLKNIAGVDKMWFQGESYITATAIKGIDGNSLSDTSGWINLQAQWGVNLWYQNQKKARMYGNKFQFWCNIEPQSGYSVSGSSDARLKHNIVDVKESSLEKLEKIQFKNFTWNSNNKDDFGFIAQEVINIIPEIIEESEDGYYRYNSTRFNMIVAHATKELNDKVKFLENKIERLERIINGN